MLTLEEVRALPPIPSGYRTQTILSLMRSTSGTMLEFRLEEERLPRPIEREYDSGDLDEWMEPYLETAPLESLQFLGAYRAGRPIGLLSWSKLEWNETIWLVDVRVSERERRRGAGRALLAWLQREAESLGTRGIFVETQISNVPAVRFYQKHGFQIAGFNDHLYDNEGAATGNVGLFLFWETPDFTGS